MANVKRKTKKELFAEILTQYDLKDKHKALIEKEISQLENRKSSEKKPTDRQLANERYKAAILDYLNEHSEEKFTITELWKNVPVLANDTEMSNQRVSALVRALKDEHKVEKEEIKRKAYFSIASAE